MKIAIPLAEGKLNRHFGHCDSFALFDVNEDKKEILNVEEIKAPPHEPGLLPRWLAEKYVEVIIAGGMGQRAQTLFREHNIKTVVGAPAERAEKLVVDYLHNSLVTGVNACSH